MKKIKLFIDMDDTLCVYKQRFLIERERYKTEYPQSQPGFYRSLDPVDGAIQTIWQLSEVYDIWFLTRPSYMNPNCYSEKRMWIEDKFDIQWCKKLIICPDKALIKGEGHYLIDDTRWDEWDGTQLLFGSEEFPDWKTVRNYLHHTHAKPILESN